MTLPDLSRVEFAHPWLLLVAPVALLLMYVARGRGRRIVRFSSALLVDGLPRTWRVRLAWLPAALLALGVVLASIALARPRVGDERTVTQTQGIAIELVVDVSSSMLAHDFKDDDGRPTDRLSAVKSVVREFVTGGEDLPGRDGDLLGLTIFAGYADPVCPLTVDHALLLDALATAEIAVGREEDGTSIAMGLATAISRLEHAEAESRVVVLLTDGVHNDDSTNPFEVAEIANELGIRVYTIGMGSRGHAPYPVVLPDGSVRMQRRATNLDEKLLERIAVSSGAIYQRAGTTEGLREIYAQIDRLERTEIDGRVYRRWRELFPLPVAAAALLWVLALSLEASVFRRLG